MHQRSPISLYKLLRRYPFHPSPQPTSSSLSKPLAKTLHTQTFSHPHTLCSASRTLLSSKPTSNSPLCSHPTCSISIWRSYSGESAAAGAQFDKNKIVDEINLKFAEAREEIEAAMESKETVYFNEEAECARDAVNQVLQMFDDLLGKLEDKEKEALRRSMGLKIEQLKAELQQLDD